MKLLLFSDPHEDKAAAAAIIRESRGVDVMIGAGDFANARHGVSSCIDILRTISVPSVLVPGQTGHIGRTSVINAGPRAIIFELGAA